ncbi:glutaredoxin family protein [Neobacillus sp. CF12]|uniref:glutaredoxin family protein n=1 Tax=Neobacillus sp. CF12 TaxID=3055864 RepID=UPI0025A2A03E|nr:glutaredoxin family protein [Neobacillus sp. CF12]MDM5330349.1 glutaredoxin family protein [Neobacillus sp. CF12]
MRQTVISFYTRKRCPLCEKAKKTILELKEEFNFSLEEIDIDESDELTELYGIMIPVVHIDGEEVAFGIINKIDISNRLQEKIRNF